MNAKILAKRLLSRALRKLLPEPDAPMAVLTYHSIGNGAPGSQTADRFREQMSWLGHHRGKFAVSAQGVPVAAAANGQPAVVLITFDDGYLDNWEQARPILDEWGFRACFFVTTGFVDGDLGITRDFRNYRGLPPMTWDHVGRLAEQGHEIGLHGETHRSFRQLSRQEAADELARSAEKLAARAGVRARTFAYPFGLLEHQRDDLDRTFLALGIQAAYTSMHRRADLLKIRCDDSYRFRIPRLRVDPADSIGVFSEKLEGYWDFVAHAQRVRYLALS